MSEKINYIKIYDKNSLKKLLTDKLEAKKYVLNLLPMLKSAKVYDVVNKFDDLDFSKYPKTFVLKTNHACKTNILVKNIDLISDIEKTNIRKFYNLVLKLDYAYYAELELQYSGIKPKLYVEEYLENINSDRLITEFELYCFNGEPEFIRIIESVKYNITHSFYKSYILDKNLKTADFSIFFGNGEYCSENIDRIKILFDYARILSKEFDFVRVDFLEVNNEFYFAEMTFTPASGFLKFIPDRYDLIWGNKLKIDLKK